MSRMRLPGWCLQPLFWRLLQHTSCILTSTSLTMVKSLAKPFALTSQRSISPISIAYFQRFTSLPLLTVSFVYNTTIYLLYAQLYIFVTKSYHKMLPSLISEQQNKYWFYSVSCHTTWLYLCNFRHATPKFIWWIFCQGGTWKFVWRWLWFNFLHGRSGLV
jgi:hypothetical protein